MLNPLKLIAAYGDLNKLQALWNAKGTTMNKFPQYLALAVSLAGSLGVPALAQSWIQQPGHLTIYTILVGVAILLHAILPSIFGAPSDAAKKATGLSGMILFALALGMASTATAQTATPASTSNGFVASSSAVALNYNGTWSAATHIVQSYDLYDWGATKSNRLYLDGHELLAPTPGFSIYAGGLRVDPDLTALFKKTNLPAGTLGAQFYAGLGNGIPANGGSHVSGLVGGLVKYRATSALTWNALEAQWVRYGSQNGVALSTGLAFFFGGGGK